MPRGYDIDRDSMRAPVLPTRYSAADEWPDDLDDLRTVVTVSRSHPGDIQERHVIVRLDEHPKVKLAYGDSFTAEVEPGRHVLKAHNTLFWKNITFTIEAGEHLEFIVINSGRW